MFNLLICIFIAPIVLYIVNKIGAEKLFGSDNYILNITISAIITFIICVTYILSLF